MSRVLLILLLLPLHRVVAQANLSLIPSSGKTVKAFVPKGWSVTASAEEDFNNDNIADQAVVIEANKTHRMTAPDCIGEERKAKMMFIVFGQADGSFVLSAKSQQLFANEDCVADFKFLSIGKRNKTLELVFNDESLRGIGSDYYYYFRYQKNDWYLIGYTHKLTKVTDPDAGVWGVDVNLVTGAREDFRLQIPANSDVLEGPKKITKRSKQKVAPLRLLTAINPNTLELQ